MGSLQRQLLVAALAALSFASAAHLPAWSASDKHEGGVSAAGSDKCGVPVFGDEKRSDRPTVGLALGGGGMRGAAHAGVLRVLISEGIPVDYVAGTSMGSVVGGLLASGMGPDEIEEHFTKGSLMRSFITVPLGLRLAVVPFFYLPRLVGIRQYDGFYRGNKFRDYLNKMVPACAQKIEGLGIPFCAVAVNLLDGKEYAIKSGNLGEALQASCAVPVLRRPVGIGDKLFVDGGVLVNLPVKHARDMGADMVIAVDVDETPETVHGREFKGIGGVAHRVLTLNLWKIDESQRQGADVLIHPNVNGIGLISTKTKDARAAIAAGEEAARQALPEIKRRLLELAREKDLK